MDLRAARAAYLQAIKSAHAGWDAALRAAAESLRADVGAAKLETSGSALEERVRQAQEKYQYAVGSALIQHTLDVREAERRLRETAKSN